MTIKSKSKFITFNDGLADCYNVTDRKITKEKQLQIHFAQATVGERRYWDAYVSASRSRWRSRSRSGLMSNRVICW